MSRRLGAGRGSSTPAIDALCLVLVAAIVLGRIVLPSLQDEQFGVATTAAGGGWSSDFVGILTFVRALWSGEAGYDLPSHLRVTGARVGRVVEHALPFGYPPTILWVLGPFCLLPDAWSFAAWSALGIAAVWWILRSASSPWVAAACLSPLLFACFSLGQTALLTTAGVLYLARRDLERRDGDRTASAIPCALVLWALSAKPPIAITAGAALLGAGRRRTVAMAAVLAIVSVALLTPVIGVGWIDDYLRIISRYDLEGADPAFADAIAPHTMNNLRAFLHVSLGAGDGAASRVSSVLWLSALLAIAMSSLRPVVPPTTRWVGAIFAYLLFFPHLTLTEDLLLLAVLVLWRLPGANRSSGLLVAGLSILVLYLAAGLVLPDALRVAVVFAIKLLLAIVCLRACWRGSEDAGPALAGVAAASR